VKRFRVFVRRFRRCGVLAACLPHASNPVWARKDINVAMPPDCSQYIELVELHDQTLLHFIKLLRHCVAKRDM
jgi:hypothetical protein